MPLRGSRDLTGSSSFKKREECPRLKDDGLIPRHVPAKSVDGSFGCAQDRHRPPLQLKLALLCLLLLPGVLPAQTPPGAPAQTGKPVFEEWCLLVLEGKPCGFGSTITTEAATPAGPGFLTVHQEQFVVKRLSAKLKIIQTSRITEDAEGGIVSYEVGTSGVGTDIRSTGTRAGDQLVVTSRGQTRRYTIPRLASLGPEKIRRLGMAIPLKAGQTFSFHTFLPDYPQATVLEQGTIVGREKRDVRGTGRELWKTTSETSITPGLLSTSWVDDDNNDVESLTVLPGIGSLHEYVTNRAECMKQPEGAEIFESSLIRPDRAIPTPDDQAQATYRLTIPDISKKLDLWNQGEQRIISSIPGACEIEVTVPRFKPGDATWQLPHADTPELHPYLQASSYLEVDSPEIQELAKLAVKNEKNPVKAAHLIEHFVRGYITRKDLSVGFASAQETAQSREGDCTEHAVLCAALGRAVGLPTRCVIGFGYVGPGEFQPAVAQAGANNPDTGVFGFHMWAEAWIGPDEWVPMDAALDGFDVGHIAINKSALSEINPLLDLNAPVMQLMENLKITLLTTVPKSRFSTSTAPTLAPLPPPAGSPSAPYEQEPKPRPLAPVPVRPSLPPVD